MSSPVRLTNPYPVDYRTPTKSLRVDIPKELNSVERRAFELTKTFSQSISEAASKSRISSDYDDSSPWDHHKVLVKRGEDYSQYIYEQNSRDKKEKQEAVNQVNQRVKRALGELDEIREQENKGLVKKILDFNNDFGKKIKELERNVAKQIEKLKCDLMENIRNEEKECEKRIGERSQQLIEDSIPASKKELNNKHIRISSAGSSPSKYSVASSPDKKAQVLSAMKRLEESREKIREIKSNAFSATPIKENNWTSKKYNSGLDEYKRTNMSDAQDFQDSWQ